MPTPPSPSPCTNNNHAQHNIVFTIPRTSSHLLIQVLNLPAQQAIYRHPSDGYFFVGPLVQRLLHHIAGKDVSTWTSHQKDSLRDAFQKSYDSYSIFLADAERQGKGTFVKDHVNWYIDPIAETRFLHAPRASTPPSPSKANPDAPSSTSSPRFAIAPTSGIDASCSPGNETTLPDAVLRTLRPTFLIRSPLLTFPSLLRTSIDNEGLDTVLQGEQTHRWEMTFHWSRALYEFYVSGSHSHSHSPSLAPIILDADDIHNPKLMAHYASLIGLDPSLIRYSWPPASEDEIQSLSKVEVRMKDTLLKSRGIVKGKTSEGLVAEEEVRKWKVEFGDVLAGRLEGCLWAEGGMRDYDWLWERRLRVEG